MENNKKKVEGENPSTPNKEKAKVTVSPEERDRIIDCFVTGTPIEKTVTIIKSGEKEITARLRMPTIETTAISDNLLYQTKGLTVSQASYEYNNNLIALYVLRLGEEEFLSENSEDSSENINNRVKAIRETLINPIRTILMNKIKEFDLICDEVFKLESLKDF